MSRGGKPLWSFTSLGDTGNGFLSAISILQALYHRDRTGEGQFCDTSIVNAQLLNSSYAVARPDGTGFERPRIDGMQLGRSATQPPVRDARRLAVPGAAREAGVAALRRRRSGFAADARFASAAARAGQRCRACARCWRRSSRRTLRPQWFALLDKAGVPCEVSDPKFSLGVHEDRGVQEAWLGGRVRASLRRQAQPDRPAVRFLGHAGPRAGAAADRRPAQPRDPRGTRLHERADRGDVQGLRTVPGASRKGHRKVRSPWQPQAPAAAAEQK